MLQKIKEQIILAFNLAEVKITNARTNFLAIHFLNGEILLNNFGIEIQNLISEAKTNKELSSFAKNLGRWA